MEDEKKLLSTEEANEDIIEQDAVDSLDALLFDADDDISVDGDEETEDFEAFMAEYSSLIMQPLNEKKEVSHSAETPEKPIDEQEAKREYEEEYLKPVPKKQSQKKKNKVVEQKEEETKSDWNEDITLEPEEYESLYEEGDILDELENDDQPDFDLGEQEADNKFQLSISFDEANKPEAPTVIEEEKPFKYDPEKPRAIDWVFDIAEIFVFVLAAVILLTTFVFKHSVVEGSSMNDTLAEGEHLIISNLFYAPERGDIIVFEDYSTPLKKAVIKRIIALPGETVEVKLSNDRRYLTVYINGEPLDEEYAFYDYYGSLNPCGPITLGENEIFVMGDNRMNSTDSCDSEIGPIDIDSITGKVLFRFFPFDKFGAVD